MEGLSEKLFDFFHSIPKSYYLPIGLLSIGLIFLSVGLMQLGGSPATHEAPPVSSENVLATTSARTSFGLLQVDVEGAVVSTGVYSLKQNSRVQDALVAAGGMSALADRELVAKTINLAAKLLDGAKIYIPKIGEAPIQGSSTVQAVYSGAQVHLVDINMATSEELDGLPGIGTVTAQKIIAGRPYTAIDDLLSRKIVSASVFNKIKESITVY